MARSMTALLVTLLFLSSASASLDRRERPAEIKLASLKSLFHFVSADAKNDEYRITEKTEVLLDGRPCRYEQIPKTATIVLMETLTNESKEITRIHFRSGRRTTSPTSK